MKIARLRVRKSEAAFLRPSRRIKTIASLCAIYSFHGASHEPCAWYDVGAEIVFWKIGKLENKVSLWGGKNPQKNPLLLVFSGAKSVEVKVAVFPWSLARLMTRKLLWSSAGNRRFSSLFCSFLQTQSSVSASCCSSSRRKSGRRSKTRQAGEVADLWSSVTALCDVTKSCTIGLALSD